MSEKIQKFLFKTKELWGKRGFVCFCWFFTRSSSFMDNGRSSCGYSLTAAAYYY